MTNYQLHNDCKNLAQRAYPENRHLDTNGWKEKGAFINDKSGFYADVYEKGVKAMFVIRGTDLKSGVKEFSKDAFSDVEMAYVYLPEQMKDAGRAYLEVVKKYGKENVVLTGHSLGASEAQILGAKYGAETITFAAYGTKSLRGVEVNYTKNITNYGNAEDGIFVKNIDNQIGKTMVLNGKGVKNGIFKKGYSLHNFLPSHSIESYGDLSKGKEYKKDAYFETKDPLFKLQIEHNEYIPDEILKTKNRVLHQGEINLNDLKKGTPLFDLYIQNIISNKPMPTKAELDKRVRIGELIYVNEYVRSDGTKVSGYYRSYPRD